MQCPIPVEGRECGAEAKTKLRWTYERDAAVAMHFSCEHGHRFHIDPRERWQACHCYGQETVAMGEGSLRHNEDAALRLMALAEEKGIQAIVPPGKHQA
jgi:hypothetical protein